MGRYTKNLYRRGRKAPPTVKAEPGEYLVGCAIIRNGTTYSGGFRSHAEVRRELGDETPYVHTPGDLEGFMTNTGRFLTRDKAKVIGEAAGQCKPMVRELLSSDIDWRRP